MSDFDTKSMVLFQQGNQNFNLGLYSFSGANVVKKPQTLPLLPPACPPPKKKGKYEVICLPDTGISKRLSLT